MRCERKRENQKWKWMFADRSVGISFNISLVNVDMLDRSSVIQWTNKVYDFASPPNRLEECVFVSSFDLVGWFVRALSFERRITVGQYNSTHKKKEGERGQCVVIFRSICAKKPKSMNYEEHQPISHLLLFSFFWAVISFTSARVHSLPYSRWLVIHF